MVPIRTLEVPLDSLQSAVLAAPYADRLELCDDLASEGWSPSVNLVRSVRAAVEVELVAMVRPRVVGASTALTIAGFTANEVVVDSAVREIEEFARAGADSVAIGLLTGDGLIDMEACGRLVATAHGAGLTVGFLRTFDLLVDRERGMRNILALGVTRLLTAGVLGWDAASATLEERLAVIELDVLNARRCAATGSAGVEVVVGGGVRSSNALAGLAVSPHLHASCRRNGVINRDELAMLREQLAMPH